MLIYNLHTTSNFKELIKLRTWREESQKTALRAIMPLSGQLLEVDRIEYQGEGS